MRPTNFACVAPPRSPGGAGATIGLEQAFPNLTFTQPLAMLQAPGDDTRWFVLQKSDDYDGTVASVRVFENTPDVSTASDFLTLPVNGVSEGGLLGMAFHPQWAANREAFLSFTEDDFGARVHVLARFRSTDDGATLDPSTRQDIIRIDQRFQNHNGGHVAFGPDGYLYFGLGDGGGGGDPLQTAQDTTDLLGSMLRLDVDGAAPYDIPPDNPFAGNPVCPSDQYVVAENCPEIFAWGFRNPWRWSFDEATGDLWLGDVGQEGFEEVNLVARGGNYGWDCREGTSEFATTPSCSAATGLIAPVHEYDRSQGYSVTGGYVYRGTALPALVGHYVFADYGSGRIWRLVPDGSGFAAEELFDGPNDAFASFGQGNDGELYIVDIVAGTLHRLVGGSAPMAPTMPTQLSNTGCVSQQNPSQPASGLIPYEPSSSFWSDNAAKERWLAIPNGASISVGADGDFTFPSGTVLMKHFRLNGALIETRLFMRHPDGEWAGYTYEWNAQRTDATLVDGGKTVAIGSQSWVYPRANDCLRCHTAAAGFALGLETAQLNRELTYPSTGRTANQLRTLDSIAVFTTPLGDPALQPTMPSASDPTAPLGQRARAYLHTNCSGCHRPNGPTPSSMDLRYSTLLSSTNTCDAIPQAGDLGIGATARIIAPGSGASSVLLARMDRRDAGGMPPLSSNIADTAGVRLVEEWIASLTSCQ